MMSALLIYSRTSDPHFPIALGGEQTTTPLQILRDVVLHVPKWPDPRYNLGVALEAMGHAEDAARHFVDALQMDPAFGEAWTNLGNCLLSLGEPDAAKHCFDVALTLNPADALTRYNLSHALMLFGDWEESYRLYEYRYLMPGHLRDCGLPWLVPPWDGHSYVHRLIVTDEQGAGDIIQFARFLPLLRTMVGSVFCRVRHPGLIPLLEQNFPGVHYFGEGHTVIPGDAHLPLLSAVNRLGVLEHQVPLAGGYLTAPQPVPKGERPRVGVCWAGSPSHKRDATRSIPWDVFRPLLDVPGVEFVKLTVGPRATVEHPALVSPTFTNYVDTANVVAGCDLVITVDTSVLHLAGALGVPVWGLIAAAPDSRWGLRNTDGSTRTHSPWYESLTLIRQTRADAWPDVIAYCTDRLRTQFSTAHA